MSQLAYMHPAQLLLGAVVVGEELATKNRQTTFASLCRDAVGWAVETRDVLREIAADAAFGEHLVAEVAADGVITHKEAASLKGLFNEIETEATEGRII